MRPMHSTKEMNRILVDGDVGLHNLDVCGLLEQGEVLRLARLLVINTLLYSVSKELAKQKLPTQSLASVPSGDCERDEEE